LNLCVRQTDAMKGVFVLVPCLQADDTSTLLSVTSRLSLESASALENFMSGVDGRNVTQMASLMQNLVESQLFGDGVTENALDGGAVNLDADIQQALKTIKELLLGDIQRALNSEHSADQKAVDKLHTCWDQCNSAHDDDQAQVDELFGFMKSSKSEHEKCRKDVHAKYIDKIVKCNELDLWIDNLKCPDCYKEECVVVHDPSSRKVGDMLQAHVAWATRSYAEWTEKHTACATAVREHEDVDTKCDKTQGSFETNTCAYRQALWTACNVNQMACCKRCSIQFDDEVNRVECAEKDRKIDWSATKKIECYIDVLMASPTDDQLQAACKADGKACINQWREAKYKSCEDVCMDVDFEAGEYRVVDGVNTTHRTDSSSGNRCTRHLDIHFPAKPRCVDCPPPIPGPCEEPWISTHYTEYDSKLPVPGLEDENECHPDLHQQWWAYSRAECRPCPALIGRPTKPVTKWLGTCTCTMTSDNDIDYVYVDGVDMTRQVTNYNDLGNWPTNNQLTFECSELTKMAVQASDGNTGSSAGCAGGGFGMKCSSTVKESPWHNFETGSHWKAWGAQCTTVPCKYGGSGDDKNTYSPQAPANWFAKDFDDSAWKPADAGNHIGRRTGAGHTICSQDGPGWLFRTPDFV